MSLVSSLLLAALPSFLSGSNANGGGTDWPQFRGASGTGAASAAEFPLKWSSTEHLAWKVAVPGQGWSQPVVLGELVLVTAAVGDGLEHPMNMADGIEDPRTMKAAEKAPDVTIDWRVLAYDLGAGTLKWEQSVVKAKPAFPIHPSNTYATETVCADKNGVYAFFGATGTLAAFDLAGKPLWKKELGVHPTAFHYGTSASPALHEGKLFVQCYDEERADLVCFDAAKGAELWRVSRPAGTSWATPLVWANAKRVEVVSCNKRLLVSHDPATGKELWRADEIDVPSSSSFAADAEQLYFGLRSPFKSGPLYAIRAGAEGDQSPEKGKTDVRCQAWATASSAPGMPSPVAADGLVYALEGAILSCFDAASGERLYKQRVGEQTQVVASPIVCGDRLIVLGEDGRTVVLRVGPDYEVLGQGQLDDLFWASPAVSGKSLLLRGADALYRVR